MTLVGVLVAACGSDSARSGLDAAPAVIDAADALTEVPANLPGAIGGVEPESHAHHPPMSDGNGNLYRITETPFADGNHPRMMKSSDRGESWVEVDADNRPEARDLEGGWQLQSGTSIYSIFTRGQDVWWNEFHTSDALTQPDAWITEERLETGLSSSGMIQFSSLTRTSDGQFWLFYSDEVESSRQQIAYRRRMGADTYSAKANVGASSGSWTAPVSVLGAADVTHLFYKDHLAHRLYWRTLDATGVLSDATRIDTSGTSAEAVPHTNAVVYDRGGDEVVVIAYTDATGVLASVTITNGVVALREAVSVDAVLRNPPVVGNEGAIAHLAVDGTTVHALWSDAATGDILHATRPDGGSWTPPIRVWDSGGSEAHYVYGEVYVRNARSRLGYTYDIGPHPDDEGNIEFNELTLP